MIKKLIAAIFSAVVVIGIIVAVIILNNPKYVFKKSLTGAVEDLGKRSELSMLTQALEKGSITIDGTLGEDIVGEDAEVSFGGKFYFDAGKTVTDSSVYVENLYGKVSYDGEGGEISGNAYFSTEYMYVADCNLMDGCYGLVRGDLKDTFEDSEWIDELIGEDDDIKDSIANVLEYIDKEKDLKLAEDISEKVEEYTKVVEDLLVKYAEFEKETKKINCGDGKVSCRVITMTLDEKAVANMVEDLYEVIEKDDDLRDLVTDNAEDILAMWNVLYETESLDVLEMVIGVRFAFDPDMDAKDIEDLYDDEFLDEDNWDDLVKMIEEQDFELSISVATGKMSTTLRQLSVVLEGEISGEEGELEFVLNFGKKGIKKTNHISASYAMDSEDMAEPYELDLFSYEISENSKKMYKAALSLPEYDSSKDDYKLTERLTIEVNREKDKFEGTWISDFESDMTGETVEERYVLSGKFVEDGDTVTITVQEYAKIYDGDTDTVDLDISVTIDKKDKMPKLEDKKDVKSIFELDMDDIEELEENLEEEFEGVLFRSVTVTPEETVGDGYYYDDEYYSNSDYDDWN